MQAAPAPARARLAPARVAGAQASSAAPSANVLTHRGTSGRRMPEASWIAQYNDWQAWAKRYTRQLGAASFAELVVSDCCARCDIFVEERDPTTREWHRSEDPAFVGLMDLYRNPLQGPDELIRLHAGHYQVAGEMLQTQVDATNGTVEYGIYSVDAVEWDKPIPGQATVKFVPDGKVDDGTAFVVPRDQVVRFWNPDREWQAYAWSPMAATIEDLHRLRSLSRYVMRTADSLFVMNGALWAPQGPFETAPDDDNEDGDGDIGTPKRGLEEDFYDAMRLRFSDTDDVASIAPMLLHWDKDEGKPEFVKMGEGLDSEGIAHRKEALEDFARGTNLPVTTLVGGGVGDANHWSEWLASDKFVDSGIRPTMDRVCFLDLTRSFLWPRARFAGRTDADLIHLRIGYDATPIIVKPDRTEAALKYNRAGLLKDAAALEAAGWDEEDRMVSPEEREWLLQVLAGKKAGDTPFGASDKPVPKPVLFSGDSATDLSAGPGNVTQLPPSRPTSQVASVLAKALLAYAGDGERVSVD